MIDGQQEAIAACGTASRAGRVLVQMSISADGVVRRATVKSTSLRHPATEQCLLDVLKGTSFPHLSSGNVARITYPFAFEG